jgi:transcriptional regulator with XRE-family HTH domain
MPKAGSTPGAIIRSARQKKGLTGADLGRLVGTSKETIHKIEKGLTRNSSALPEIARVLELPLSAFAGQPGSTKGHDDNEAAPARSDLSRLEVASRSIRAPNALRAWCWSTSSRSIF